MKKLSVLSALLLLLALLSPVPGAFAAEVSAPEPEDVSVTGIVGEGLGQPVITAKAAIVVELNSGIVLYEKNKDEARSQASLTKIMTVLLALEANVPPDEIVTASEDAFFDITDDGSTAGIKPGEEMSFENLLYCIMVASANEACNIVAERVAGSVPAFVARMNARARELGCKNTNFVNTHGMPADGHYTSAYDMFLMTKEALSHAFFIQLANTAGKAIPPTNMRSTERALLTTNSLISKNADSGYAYSPARGIKTGHHSKAGYCLASSAESDGLYIVTVVLGSEKTEDGKIHSFIDTKELMQWSFDTYEFRRILGVTAPVDTVRVKLGLDADTVNLLPARSVTALIPKTLDTGSVRRTIEIHGGGDVTAPVTKGQELGALTLTYKGYTFDSVPLVSDIAVRVSEQERITEEVKSFFENPALWYALAGFAGLLALWVLFTIAVNLRRRKNIRRGNYKGKRKY